MNKFSGLSALRALTIGNPQIKIAVLDGPVDLEHPCFNTSGNSLEPFAYDRVQPSASVGLAKNHGTAVCSLIFGKPGSMVEGVAPGCSGLIIPIYSENDKGEFTSASQAGLAAAINTAVEKGANIINISGGEFSKYGDAEFLLKKAIDDCYKAGVLIVAATGNEGCRCLHVPAADNQVLAVGSMDENGNPTPETNFGDHYKVNGIIAPGKNLTAALPGGKIFTTNGATSYATPVVSGVVGLLMSLQLQRGLKPDAYVIKSILESTAIPCSGTGGIDCNRFLRGKLNLPAAIKAISNNPGILASGTELYTQPKNTVMPHALKTTTDEIVLSSLPEIQEVFPSDMQKEIALETQLPAAETAVIADNPVATDNIPAVTPSSAVMEVVDVLQVNEQPDSLSRHGPSINPSDEASTASDLNNSNQSIKILNSQTMEQNTANQNTEVPVLHEVITDTGAINPSGEIDPSDCGCGGGKADAPAIVYALGNISYDFGSEAHRDSFVQSMGGANPNDPAAILKYLKANPQDAEELVWTLNIDATPVYAIYPTGNHGHLVYAKLREYFEQQQNGTIQRISVPGQSKGSTRLLMGHTVSNLFPRQRGMFSWTTEALVSAATGAKGSARALAENVTNFLNRIYYQMRNLGITPQERALNYAATNAFQISSVFASALKENLELNDISAVKSPICRPGSDCYDVTLSFFNPKERLTQARKEYRFTVDVSDVVPVTVGEIRTWSVY